MNPIISPVWIYLIHLADAIYNLAVVGIFTGIASLILLFVERTQYDADIPDEVKKVSRINRWMRVSITAIIVGIVIMVVVPDKKTVCEMMAASMITPDNISSVENHTIDLIKEIANAVAHGQK